MAQPYQFQNYEGAEMEQLFDKMNRLGPATTEEAGLMSAADKTKLDGVASGAEANVLESVKVNGVVLDVLAKAVNIILDNAPESGSGNFISSGGVYAALLSYYTKVEVDAIVAGLKQFTYEVVAELPTASAETMYCIYFVPSSNPKTRNIKDEYITVRSGSEGSYVYSWEMIGSSAVDISGKADKDPDAVEGNIAKFDSNGNPVDSGINKDDVAKVDGMYDTLVSGASKNLVGRGFVPALFTFRTTGGSADVGTGTAQIKKLYGNSIVWNQLIPIKSSDASITQNNVTITDNRDGSYTIQTTAEGASARTTLNIIQFAAGLLTGHKVAILGISGGNVGNSYSIKDAQSGAVNTGDADVRTINSNDTVLVGISVASGAIITTPVTVRPQLVDLTLMFGEGNEPATVEEFEALYYLNYFAYNPGAIKNTTAIGIKTTGFNQWDEQWELGTISISDGQNATSATDCRSKNYISIFPGTNYHLHNGGTANRFFLLYYDANKNFLSYASTGSSAVNEKDFTTPAGAYFMRFVAYQASTNYGTTYNNDICINLSWSGYRNGEYEPYWSRTINLPLTTMTGKLNGEGESVVIAPDGWMSAGNARFVGIIENGMLTKVEKHVKQVDLGTLAWTIQGAGGASERAQTTGLNATIQRPSAANIKGALLSTKYVNATSDDVYAHGQDKTIAVETSGQITCYDSALIGKTAAEVEAAMDGVMLNYALAIPEVYVLDEPINMNYSEDDFGTEERLPADTADNVSAPIFFDVQYPMNAVDILRRLGVNYIKKESMVNFLEALKSAGVISAYTMTYNSTNDDYNFTITPPTE